MGSVSDDGAEAQKLLADARAASQERMKRELGNFLQAVAEAQPLVTAERPSGTGTVLAPSPSIAVLPFVNISNDPDNEYFCDGLAEELLNALSKIEALRVAARTSSFSFKGKETDIREIGRKLNVGAVLEGSVRKSGDRLRITAQLVNMADGYHLWSERYDREMRDIFDIQEEITLAMVDALKVKLLGADKAAVTRRYTDNTEAYRLYLLGRYQFGKYSEEGFSKAVAYFRQAIGEEPGYAPAWAALANSYRALWYFGYLPPAESVPQWKEAIARAMAIDQSLAECHISRALLMFFYERDFPAAEKEFKRALELNPNYAEAHEQYGLFLAAPGRAAEAMMALQRALELDPLSLVNNIRVGWSYWAIGRYDHLRAQSRKLIELEPGFYGGYWMGALGGWVEGKYEEAIVELEKAVNLGGSSQTLSMLGCLYGLAGQRDKARRIHDKLLEAGQRHGVLHFNLAIVLAGLGELDGAFAALEQAREQREGWLVFLRPIAALIPGLGADPRLAGLLRRIGLPQCV
ncbi:MAG: tetratricopeptide repeat protein [Blastocatellia bacterium]